MTTLEKAKQPPSVARNVHYYRPGCRVDGGPPVPAVIAVVLPPPDDEADTVLLFAMDPIAGPHFETASYSSIPAPGKWSYPPYVPPAILEKQSASTVMQDVADALAQDDKMAMATLARENQEELIKSQESRIRDLEATVADLEAKIAEQDALLAAATAPAPEKAGDTLPPPAE